MTTAQKRPLIIAHRGASAVAPENTLAAFARAIKDAADGIELDVRLARDGVPMVIHDATLRRTAAREGAVADFTSTELNQIDVGSWFNRMHPRLRRLDYERERLPTFAQACSLISSAPVGVSVYVELKTDGAEDSAADLAASVCALISSHRLLERAIVVSFDLATLKQVKTLNPSISTGALFAPRVKPLTRTSGQATIDAAIESGAEEILLHRLIARPGMIALALRAGLRPVVWTVDDPKWIARADQLGIHALLTNGPAKLISKHRATS